MNTYRTGNSILNTFLQGEVGQETAIVSTRFTLDFVRNYLWIQHTADYEITLEGQCQLWAAIGEACAKYHCWRVLAECPTPPRQHLSQSGALKSAMHAAKASRQLRVACVFPEYEKDEITELLINTAYNMGVRIEYFAEREAAIKWLDVNQ
jgi:hypothetical protein